MSIMGNVVGASMLTPKSFVLEAEDGTSFVGVTVGEETVFNATPLDVKINKTFAGEDGVQTGENTITYRTRMATRTILPGEEFSIPLEMYEHYDYTQFQGIIVLFNEEYGDSAKTLGITIDDNLFSTETSMKLANITKNLDTKSIDFNITNNSENTYSIRYFTYREEEENYEY